MEQVDGVAERQSTAVKRKMSDSYDEQSETIGEETVKNLDVPST